MSYFEYVERKRRREQALVVSTHGGEYQADPQEGVTDWDGGPRRNDVEMPRHNRQPLPG